MKRVRTGASLWAIGVVAVLTLLTLTDATYAWFSSNREVETSRVTARTGSDKLELQISSLGGDAFRPMQDASGENNEVTLRAQENPLLPVSTADLAGFVYAPCTVDGRAENFLPATDETRYYHETIYLRAVGTGMPEGTRIALYLDNPGEPLVQDTDGTLLTAARLIAALDTAQGQAIYHLYILGETVRQTAAAMHTTESAVRGLRRRARDALRAMDAQPGEGYAQAAARYAEAISAARGENG